MKHLKSYRQYEIKNDSILEKWYHGSPDARDIEKIGGFSERMISVDYVTDVEGLKKLQNDMTHYRENGNMDNYHKCLNMVSSYKKDFIYKKPLYLSDKYQVAKTYADPNRAFDYQDSLQKTYEVDIDCNKCVKIIAIGDRFRFINIDKVKSGFIDAGISESEIDKTISMFNYYIPDNKGIKTDVVAAIGNWFGFDCIDVVGVLDSYHGGNVKSTVRIVLNPTKIKII